MTNAEVPQWYSYQNYEIICFFSCFDVKISHKGTIRKTFSETDADHVDGGGWTDEEFVPGGFPGRSGSCAGDSRPELEQKRRESRGRSDEKAAGPLGRLNWCSQLCLNLTSLIPLNSSIR